MLSDSLALLPLPDHGWLQPADAERWLCERAPGYTLLLMEGFRSAARARSDPWALLAMDVAIYTAAAARAAFEGRPVRLARDEGDRVAVGALADLVALFDRWLQSDAAGPETAAAACDEVRQALRALGARPEDAALEAGEGDGDA